MTNEELTERFLKMQAHLMATQLAVRYLLNQFPPLAEYLHANSKDLGDALLASTATDAQVEEASEALHLLSKKL